jgi:hypothetical protein
MEPGQPNKKSNGDDPIGRAVEANARFHPVHIDSEIVSRPAGPATQAIHSFLRHIRSKGLTAVPEPVGIQDGFEKLRFIEGASGGEGWFHQHTDEGLASAARLLRAIHDASVDWIPPAGTPWNAPAVSGDEVVYCHGDPGPWNFVWRNNEAIGLIDWDYLHSAPRIDDVAYALQWFVPMRADKHAIDWHHFTKVPDRRERVRTFINAYGDLPDFDVVDAVVARMQATSDLVRDLAERGIEPQRTWVADGSLKRDAEEIAWVLKHRDELEP